MAAQTSAVAAKRVPGRPFQKGRSGNPGGRTKADWDFRAKCREAAACEGFEAVLEIAHSLDRTMRFKAWEFIINHGFGKAPEKVELAQERPTEIVLDFRADAK